MKKISKHLAKLTLCFMMVSCLNMVSAQNLYVQLAGAEQIAFPLADKPKITFSEGVVMVNETVFQLPTVQNLSFTFNPDAPTSIATDVEPNNKITIFPNPVQDELTLIVEKETQGLRYHIFDLNGKRVKTAQINSQQTTIRMQNLRTGTYILNIDQNGQPVQSLKIVKQ